MLSLQEVILHHVVFNNIRMLKSSKVAILSVGCIILVTIKEPHIESKSNSVGHLYYIHIAFFSEGH